MAAGFRAFFKQFCSKTSAANIESSYIYCVSAVSRMITGDILFESNPNPMWVYDLETLAFLEVNRAAIEKYGFSRERFMQLTIRDIRPADSISKLEQRIKEVGSLPITSQSIWVHKDARGRQFHVKISSNYTSYNGRAARLTVITDVEDIFQQQEEIDRLNKQLQQNIGFSEERFKGTFDHSAIGMAIVSHEGKLLQVNKSLCTIWGYNREELLSKTFQELTYPSDLELDMENFREMLTGKKQSYQLEKRYIHKKGHIVWTVLTVSVSRASHSPVAFVAQVLDITEAKEKEQRLNETVRIISEQNSRLNNFAYIVSHNLRTHSNHFEIILDLIRQSKDEQEKAALIERMQRISFQLRETIGYLHEVISIQTQTSTQRLPLNLKSYVDKTLELLAADIEQSNARLTIAIDPFLQIDYNPAYLESILLNFISNAIKYRRPGIDPQIQISSHNENNKTILEIADNGLGIDMNMYGNQLFGMYQTFHGNSNAKGIGLFIAKNQLEAMGGKVEVVSEVGKGSLFRLFL